MSRASSSAVSRRLGSVPQPTAAGSERGQVAALTQRTALAAARSVTDLLLAHANTRPAERALRFQRQATWHAYSWQSLQLELTHLAGGLAARGLAAGDKLLVLGERSPRLLLLTLAAFHLRASVVLVEPSASRGALQRALDAARPALSVVEAKPELALLLTTLNLSSLAQLPHTVVMTRAQRTAAEPVLDYDQLRALGTQAPAPAAVSGSDPNALAFEIHGSADADPEQLTHAALLSAATRARGAALHGASLLSFGSVLGRPLREHGLGAWLAHAPCLSLVGPGGADVAALRELSPEYLLAGPAQYAALQRYVDTHLPARPAWRRRLVEHALLRASAQPPAADGGTHWLQRQLVLRPLRARLGLRRLRGAWLIGERPDPATERLFRGLGSALTTP